jgi:hypothetical protein
MASQGIDTQVLKVALSGQWAAEASEVGKSALRVRSNLPGDRHQGLRLDPSIFRQMILAVFTCSRGNICRAGGSSARLHQLVQLYDLPHSLPCHGTRRGHCHAIAIIFRNRRQAASNNGGCQQRYCHRYGCRRTTRD